LLLLLLLKSFHYREDALIHSTSFRY